MGVLAVVGLPESFVVAIALPRFLHAIPMQNVQLPNIFFRLVIQAEAQGIPLLLKKDVVVGFIMFM